MLIIILKDVTIFFLRYIKFSYWELFDILWCGKVSKYIAELWLNEKHINLLTFRCNWFLMFVYLFVFSLNSNYYYAWVRYVLIVSTYFCNKFGFLTITIKWERIMRANTIFMTIIMQLKILHKFFYVYFFIYVLIILWIFSIDFYISKF